MKPEHIDLLQRLEKFTPDSSHVTFPFSARLAKENDWNPELARRAIEEYKRFAFLAVAADHPVSPSEIVDQVWHLHLTYTQSYWKEFCPNVLQKPFHHHPTRGGLAEQNKFEDWYAKTLASYRHFFHCEPPADIWPSPAEKRAERNEFVRVDKARHWIIPKLTFQRRAGAIVCCLLAICFMAGCRTVLGPFDLRGPEFLAFYVILFSAVLGTAVWVRQSLLLPDDVEPDLPKLDPYSIAYLNGGELLTLNCALASLINRKSITIDPKTLQITKADLIPLDAHPFEKGIFQKIYTTGIKISDLREEVKPLLQVIKVDLQKRGLIPTEAVANKAMSTSLMIVAIAPLTAIIKIIIGISRERPVSFLVIALIISVVIMAIVLGRSPKRSQRGNRVLEMLRERDAYSVKSQFVSNPTAALAATAIAFYGLDVLAGSDMADLRRTLQPPAASSGCGGGSSSGCGGDGGGGGCGGGGCGGCGGGGD